jgi:hypothetical protein
MRVAQRCLLLLQEHFDHASASGACYKSEADIETNSTRLAVCQSLVDRSAPSFWHSYTWYSQNDDTWIFTQLIEWSLIIEETGRKIDMYENVVVDYTK